MCCGTESDPSRRIRPGRAALDQGHSRRSGTVPPEVGGAPGGKLPGTYRLFAAPPLGTNLAFSRMSKEHPRPCFRIDPHSSSSGSRVSLRLPEEAIWRRDTRQSARWWLLHRTLPNPGSRLRHQNRSNRHSLQLPWRLPGWFQRRRRRPPSWPNRNGDRQHERRESPGLSARANRHATKGAAPRLAADARTTRRHRPNARGLPDQPMPQPRLLPTFRLWSRPFQPPRRTRPMQGPWCRKHRPYPNRLRLASKNWSSALIRSSGWSSNQP